MKNVTDRQRRSEQEAVHDRCKEAGMKEGKWLQKGKTDNGRG